MILWEKSIPDRGNTCKGVRWGQMWQVQGMWEATAAAACEGKHMVGEGLERKIVVHTCVPIDLGGIWVLLQV